MKITRAHELVGGFTGKRVAVVGDLMVDHYVWGRASRISQEAPVPVVQVQRESHVLGGAANVLRNVASLGGTAVAFGVVGDDPPAEQFRRQCAQRGIVCDGVVADGSRRTTLKTRVIANNQQVVRIDDEVVSPISVATRDEVVARFRAAADAQAFDAVIIEDYNKGVVCAQLAQAIKDECDARDILLAWDPHPGNAVTVSGIGLLTPNRAEAFMLAGMYFQPTALPLADDQALRKAGARLQEIWGASTLLVTLGAHGMALFSEDESVPFHVPTVAREVFDVSGAGDTVIATFVLGLAAGASETEATVLANHAGGTVVRHVGTVPVDLDELLASFD
jgi:D-beta-D-heptose 7-phosphate kinase/D-beta-D-heptose 1-phosphate adenosyltransferase